MSLIICLFYYTAQLVTSGVKGLNQQGLRATSPTGVTLSQGGQSFQLITPVQRPRVQQANLQQNVTARGITLFFFILSVYHGVNEIGFRLHQIVKAVYCVTIKYHSCIKNNVIN